MAISMEEYARRIAVTLWTEDKANGNEVKIDRSFPNTADGYKGFIDACAEAWTRLVAPLQAEDG